MRNMNLRRGNLLSLCLFCWTLLCLHHDIIDNHSRIAVMAFSSPNKPNLYGKLRRVKDVAAAKKPANESSYQKRVEKEKVTVQSSIEDQKRKLQQAAMKRATAAATTSKKEPKPATPAKKKTKKEILASSTASSLANSVIEEKTHEFQQTAVQESEAAATATAAPVAKDPKFVTSENKKSEKDSGSSSAASPQKGNSVPFFASFAKKEAKEPTEEIQTEVAEVGGDSKQQLVEEVAASSSSTNKLPDMRYVEKVKTLQDNFHESVQDKTAIVSNDHNVAATTDSSVPPAAAADVPMETYFPEQQMEAPSIPENQDMKAPSLPEKKEVVAPSLPDVPPEKQMEAPKQVKKKPVKFVPLVSNEQRRGLSRP